MRIKKMYIKKKKRKSKLQRHVVAAELPLRMRAAKMGAIANRHESLAANKAAMLRNDQVRMEHLMHKLTNPPALTTAAAEIKLELERLAKSKMPYNVDYK